MRISFRLSPNIFMNYLKFVQTHRCWMCLKAMGPPSKSGRDGSSFFRNVCSLLNGKNYQLIFVCFILWPNVFATSPIAIVTGSPVVGGMSGGKRWRVWKLTTCQRTWSWTIYLKNTMLQMDLKITWVPRQQLHRHYVNYQFVVNSRIWPVANSE